MNIKVLFVSFLLFLLPAIGIAVPDDNDMLTGIVLDKENNQPIQYATVVLLDTKYGTSTDSTGLFRLRLKEPAIAQYRAKISCVGYQPLIISLSDKKKSFVVKLTTDVRQISEVNVRKPKYHSRKNAAVELIDKVIEHKKSNKKETLEYVENDKYEKVQFAVNNISPDYKQTKIFQKFQFVFENIDSLKENGKRILPVYLKESFAKQFYRNSPRLQKEVVKAHKVVSFAGFDNKGIEDNIKYLYQDIDLYKNEISFLSNQFLSPVSPNARLFYRYYILDTIQAGNDKCARLYFSPKNKEDLLFQGYLHILLDGSYAIKKAEITVSKNVNINWINNVKVVQDFEKSANNSWMLKKDQISIDFGINKKSKGLTGQKQVTYSGYNFEKPVSDSVFEAKLENERPKDALISNDFPDEYRPEKLSKSEAGTYLAMDSIQKIPIIKKIVNVATMVFFGYYDLGKFEIGPVNTFYMYNPVEGVRLRFGGRTTDKFSKKLNLETYLAYGFKDQLPKYYLGATWSLTDRNFQQFPAKTLKVSYQRETQLPGQQMQFLMEDNILLSIKRGVNDKLFYNKTFRIEHVNEFENHFSYTVGFRNTLQAPGGNLFFNYTDYSQRINEVSLLHLPEFYVYLRYAPHEGFYQGKTFRIPIYNKYPIMELRYVVGNNSWGNDYNYHNLKLNIRKRFYFSVFGYSDVVCEAGKIFGKVPFPLLNLPQANQTYSYQIESYNMMNFLEFASDQYASLLVDHTFNGFFFNKIPLAKRLGLREMLTCKVLYGTISKSNNPAQTAGLFKFPVSTDGTPLTYSLNNTPYIEGSIGVGNIFKIFRVDLVRRFTWLDNPNVSKYGIRMRFRLDF